MRIYDGTPEDHPSVLPLNPSNSPGLAAPTPAFASGNEQAQARDLTGERLSQLAGGETAAAAAMSEGMQADGARRQHYLAAMAPLGASAGDAMDLPDVPSYQLPPPPEAGYPWAGDEPVWPPAG